MQDHPGWPAFWGGQTNLGPVPPAACHPQGPRFLPSAGQKDPTPLLESSLPSPDHATGGSPLVAKATDEEMGTEEFSFRLPSNLLASSPSYSPYPSPFTSPFQSPCVSPYFHPSAASFDLNSLYGNPNLCSPPVLPFHRVQVPPQLLPNPQSLNQPFGDCSSPQSLGSPVISPFSKKYNHYSPAALPWASEFNQYSPESPPFGPGFFPQYSQTPAEATETSQLPPSSMPFLSFPWSSSKYSRLSGGNEDEAPDVKLQSDQYFRRSRLQEDRWADCTGKRPVSQQWKTMEKNGKCKQGIILSSPTSTDGMKSGANKTSPAAFSSLQEPSRQQLPIKNDGVGQALNNFFCVEDQTDCGAVFRSSDEHEAWEQGSRQPPIAEQQNWYTESLVLLESDKYPNGTAASSPCQPPLPVEVAPVPGEMVGDQIYTTDQVCGSQPGHQEFPAVATEWSSFFPYFWDPNQCAVDPCVKQTPESQMFSGYPYPQSIPASGFPGFWMPVMSGVPMAPYPPYPGYQDYLHAFYRDHAAFYGYQGFSLPFYQQPYESAYGSQTVTYPGEYPQGVMPPAGQPWQFPAFCPHPSQPQSSSPPAKASTTWDLSSGLPPEFVPANLSQRKADSETATTEWHGDEDKSDRALSSPTVGSQKSRQKSCREILAQEDSAIAAILSSPCIWQPEDQVWTLHSELQPQELKERMAKTTKQGDSYVLVDSLSVTTEDKSDSASSKTSDCEDSIEDLLDFLKIATKEKEEDGSADIQLEEMENGLSTDVTSVIS